MMMTSNTTTSMMTMSLRTIWNDDTNVMNVLKDGQRMRVPIHMMDSLQRAIHDDTRKTDTGANHRPGWRVPDRVSDAVEDAHAEYCAWLRGAHRTGVADAKPKRPASRKLTLDAARTEAERA
jgi:hypothetical protein